MPTLQEKLNVIKKGFESQAPAEALEVMHRATQDLIDGGQAGRARGTGDTMPSFDLPDAAGNIVSSSELLAKGPLVLTFFRGHW